MSKKIKKDKGKELSQKLSIYDYEQKYTKRENVRRAKWLIRFTATVIGVFLFFCLFSIAMKIYETFNENVYVGAGAGAVCALLYIFLYIVPLCRILKTEYFTVNVNARTARAAQAHNRKVRRNIADKIIDFTGKVEGAGWYDAATVGALAVAVKTDNEKDIMAALTALYSGSVRKSARELIFSCALKSGMYSAISQTNKVDAMLVAVLDLQLVKDIVFLYGFRPSDAKLVKIFGRVLQNSLIAYGLGGVKIGNGIVQTMGNAVRGIPLLGTAIATVVDSSVQGLTNGVLTAVIGYQTVRYLNEEYKLQEILDGIEIADEEDLKETCTQLERELKTVRKPAKAS